MADEWKPMNLIFCLPFGVSTNFSSSMSLSLTLAFYSLFFVFFLDLWQVGKGAKDPNP